jgi:hypothetical protein
MSIIMQDQESERGKERARDREMKRKEKRREKIMIIKIYLNIVMTRLVHPSWGI